MATARTKKETVAGSVKPANTAVEPKVESAATKMEPVKEKRVFTDPIMYCAALLLMADYISAGNPEICTNSETMAPNAKSTTEIWFLLFEKDLITYFCRVLSFLTKIYWTISQLSRELTKLHTRERICWKFLRFLHLR